MNTTIGVQLQLHQGTAVGTVVYSKTHSPTTSDLGLFSLEVGSGTPGTGTFAAVDWSAGPYFLEVALDPTGGTNHTALGTQQVLSVPYALHATTADSHTDPQTISRTGTTVTLSNGGGSFQDSGGVYLPGNNITISSGNMIGQTTNMHPFNTINYMICWSGIFPSSGGGFDDATIGEIRMTAGTVLPANWLYCDGQLLPISNYITLFSVIGTLYGGDGINTFTLPDLRGRSPVHEGQGPGLTNRTLGTKGGVE